MKIATGRSRTQKNWKNQNISWEDFCIKVKKTTRTWETIEEYKKLTKIEQDNIKDVGGFVGGHLKEGKRKKGNVICRSLVTLDMDYGRDNIIEEISEKFDFRCCIYSTHKHSKSNTRLRLIIPLSRDVNEEEYEPLTRMLAKEIGMEMFDNSTYEACRLMYWPSTSLDGEFIFKEIEGKQLDPDVYLSKYENYKNISSYPLSIREKENMKECINKQSDPLLKENIVGTFCRTYSITEVIETFLTHIYSRSSIENRYDYIPATSAAGVVIYENKFAYSHHSTDPASTKLLNAFDLVRIHKFGHLDEKRNISNEEKSPSYDAMCDFIINDKKTKLQLSKERYESAVEEFTNIEISENENLSIKEEYPWQIDLALTKKGEIKDTLENLILIMKKDENLQNIVYNCLSDGISVLGKLPWPQKKPGWNESDNASLRAYISSKYKIYSPKKTTDALSTVTNLRTYHPIKDYLENMPPWDKTPRVDNLLIDYCGAENNSYSKAVIRKTLVAAVKRVYNPGIKFDYVLILNGPQGIGKSTLFSKLGREWFSDSLTIADMKDKSGAEKLQGYWILELGELAGIRKTDVETVKSFISRSDDKYRASYGYNVESHPRQCIIVGTTNAQDGFLRDLTGNRRFWPVRTDENTLKKSIDMTEDEVKQIWAEVLLYVEKGESLELEGKDRDTVIIEQTSAMEKDEREGLVRVYLDKLLPKNWNEMDLCNRRNFLRGNSFIGENKAGSELKIITSNIEIWSECFGNDPAIMKLSDSYAISAIMKKIENWDRYSKNKTGSKLLPIYGNQRCYERIIK
ncbi:MAG: virulence-associated E family protein [Terrisporobacter sp.]|uniref:virulence-associated E family protein n=1 Tax=Terrisporobacter sp. TaxID=1965305 RepID=UPI002FCB715B